MASTSHVRTVRERVKQLLEDDPDFDHIPIYEGPTDLVKLKFPCIVVGVIGQNFYPVAIGGIYDRQLTVRVDCYAKELDPEESMQKVEAMAEDVVDNFIDNYTLQKDSDSAVRLATGYTVAYDLIEVGNTILRDAAVIFTTEKIKS